MIRNKQHALLRKISQFISAHDSHAIDTKKSVPSDQTKHKNHGPLNEQIVTKAVALERI
jgi:hypothetical protein